jgi:hypothetical protein
VEAAGCACYECWPKEIRSDTRVSDKWLLRACAGAIGLDIGDSFRRRE